jgi:hypothetical protein
MSKKMYNLSEMSEDQINDLFTPQYKPLFQYIKDNYLNVHPNKLTVERLEQLYRNIEKWKIQLYEEKNTLIYEVISDTLVSINRQIEYKGAKKPIIKKETLSDLITHNNSLSIVDELKVQYKNIKGKRLKLLFLTMQELGLIPLDRTQAKFHSLSKIEFGDIGSYEAFRKIKFNVWTDKDEVSQMKIFLVKIMKE